LEKTTGCGGEWDRRVREHEEKGLTLTKLESVKYARNGGYGVSRKKKGVHVCNRGIGGLLQWKKPKKWFQARGGALEKGAWGKLSI